MKKYTFILALGVALTLTACGSGSTAQEKTDSVAVANVTDTTVKTADTTAPAPVGDDVVPVGKEKPEVPAVK
jgi:hypothetical protein